MRFLIVLTLGLAASAGYAGDPELLPAPKASGPHFQIEELANGVQLTLSPEGTTLLRELLKDSEGKDFTILKGMASRMREKGNVEAAVNLENAIKMMKAQGPSLRKALDDKSGPNGAVIKVFGIDKKKGALMDRPVLKAVVEQFVPPEAQKELKAVQRAIDMTPLWFRVEPRK